MKPAFFHLYIRFVAACTFLLLAAGGLVTSTGSGLSVPDWPLSYGTWFPPMVGGIRFEHTHRVIAGFVGVLTLILTIIAWRAETRRWVRFTALGALILVILQAVLGGITVIYLLPTAVSVSHACLAQTFFCLLLSLAFFTSIEWRGGACVHSEEAPALKRLLILTTAFVYLQLIAGALVRHTHGIHALILHVVLAFIIVLHLFLVVRRIVREDALGAKLSRHALSVCGLAMIQIFLGLASFYYTQMLKRADEVPAGVGEVFFRTMHQTNGALILGLCVLLTLRCHRFLRKAS